MATAETSNDSVVKQIHQGVELEANQAANEACGVTRSSGDRLLERLTLTTSSCFRHIHTRTPVAPLPE